MKKSLRFCMITTFFPPYNFGGDGIFVYRLVNELAQRGHRVAVIHCTDAYRSLARKEPSSTYPVHANVTVHGLKSPLGMLSPFLTQQTGLPLLKSSQIREIMAPGFDVIHFHNPSLVGGPGLFSFGNAVKLYTMHEYWLICPTHMLLKYNREPCTERSCLRCTLVHKRPPQWWRYTGLMKRAVSEIDAFIAPSRFIKNLHETELSLRVVYLPYFVPLSADSPPATNHTRARVPYFLFVGRLEMLKGAQTLIPLFLRFRGAQLWIAGTGTYEPELRRLAAGSENIRFLGFQSDENLRVLYRDALGAIVPSLYFENFPQVTIEAFRQRTPVVVRNLGGLPESVQESGGGFIYDSETELEAALDKLVENPSLRDELGLHGYETYQRNWTPEPHMSRYLALIEEVAARRQR